jgi:hypothetical protein
MHRLQSSPNLALWQASANPPPVALVLLSMMSAGVVPKRAIAGGTQCRSGARLGEDEDRHSELRRGLALGVRVSGQPGVPDGVSRDRTRGPR